MFPVLCIILLRYLFRTRKEISTIIPFARWDIPKVGKENTISNPLVPRIMILESLYPTEYLPGWSQDLGSFWRLVPLNWNVSDICIYFLPVPPWQKCNMALIHEGLKEATSGRYYYIFYHVTRGGLTNINLWTGPELTNFIMHILIQFEEVHVRFSRMPSAGLW